MGVEPRKAGLLGCFVWKVTTNEFNVSGKDSGLLQRVSKRRTVRHVAGLRHNNTVTGAKCFYTRLSGYVLFKTGCTAVNTMAVISV